MYQVLHDSKIAFNRHSDLADRYFANNMRLYEATGVGTLLLTDYKQNLADMFEPGREVIAYRDAHECAELADYYLKHDNEREAIAHAGQQRTLLEHTFYQRMQELVDIVRRYL
jgi:spore maturation protein CgeB